MVRGAIYIKTFFHTIDFHYWSAPGFVGAQFYRYAKQEVVRMRLFKRLFISTLIGMAGFGSVQAEDSLIDVTAVDIPA
jgi:hypothetical protein